MTGPRKRASRGNTPASFVTIQPPYDDDDADDEGDEDDDGNNKIIIIIKTYNLT